LKAGGEQHDAGCHENKLTQWPRKKHLEVRLSLRFAESALDQSSLGSMLARAFELRPKVSVADVEVMVAPPNRMR
jgi:hypothetical protein